MAGAFVINNGFGNCVNVELHMKGCTPLHWAAIIGNMEACTVLVHAGTKQELLVKDNAGFTPVQLASDKGHRHVALFLVRTCLCIDIAPFFYGPVERDSK